MNRVKIIFRSMMTKAKPEARNSIHISFRWLNNILKARHAAPLPKNNIYNTFDA
jgi:hypothetical protein